MIAVVIILETFARRWFAFAFVAALVWAAWPEGGGRRAVRFLVISFTVTLAGEYVSTHVGFPYGRYSYIAPTHGKELYISNVPLFVPISFGAMIWAGRSLALRITRSRVVLALSGAVFATLLDATLDPMTLRGTEWFLGPLYRYEAGGWWFGVPWSNFAGWLLVSAIVITLDSPKGSSGAPPARGNVLAAGICAFSIGLALFAQEWTIAFAATALSVVIAGTSAAFARSSGRVRVP